MLNIARSIENTDYNPKKVEQIVSQLCVVIVSDVESERNGVGAYYYDLLVYLQDYLAHIELICPSTTQWVPLGLINIPMPGDDTQRICIPHLRKLSKRLHQLKPDLMIIPTPGPYGLAGLRLARKLGIKVIVGFHTDFHKISNIYWQSFFAKVSHSYLRLTHHILFTNASLVLANSQNMLDLATATGAKNTELMGTFLPKSFTTPLTNINPRKPKHILFAGRLAPEKNIHLILQAAQQLPDLQFWIAGNGPLKYQVEEVATQLSNIHYLGWLSRQEMKQQMDNIDMLVLPSIVESFGTVAIEAMSRGKIVLLSAQCGLLEWPSLKSSTFQMQHNETLGDAIQRIQQINPAFLHKKVQSGRQAVLNLNQSSLEHWLAILAEHTHPQQISPTHST